MQTLNTRKARSYGPFLLLGVFLDEPHFSGLAHEFVGAVRARFIGASRKLIGTDDVQFSGLVTELAGTVAAGLPGRFSPGGGSILSRLFFLNKAQLLFFRDIAHRGLLSKIDR